VHGHLVTLGHHATLLVGVERGDHARHEERGAEIVAATPKAERNPKCWMIQPMLVEPVPMPVSKAARIAFTAGCGVASAASG